MGAGEDHVVEPRSGPGAVPVRRSRVPFSAWRAWRLVERSDGPALLSTTFRTEWDGPVLTADAAPDRDARGIYAFNERAELDRFVRFRADTVVLGQVTLFGRVAVHELGYRALGCRVDRLWLSPCGTHPVARCDCPPPAAPPGLAWRRADGCRRDHELRLPGGRVHGPTFGPSVRHAYCGCRLAAAAPLPDDPLHHLADALAVRYQCDVLVLPAARTSTGICTFLSPVRPEPTTRRAGSGGHRDGSHGEDR